VALLLVKGRACLRSHGRGHGPLAVPAAHVDMPRAIWAGSSGAANLTARARASHHEANATVLR
jgi:hypothetical protein